jgi:hypothetical protein
MRVATGSRTLLSLSLVLGTSFGVVQAAAAAPTLPSSLALQPPADPAVTDPAVPPEPTPPPPPPAAPGGLKIEGNGASLKLGFLVQPAFEYTSQSLTSSTANGAFFLRRMRLMAGLTVGSNLEFFFETDSPNLGKNAGVNPTSFGNTSALALVQDAFVTWKVMDEFKLDGGMMLIPFTHNSVQGATTLYGWDYFASSFMQSGGFANFAGRDVGAQARGLVIGHLEYRLGVFTGKRDAVAMMGMAPPSRTSLRLAGRVQYNVFDPETAYFYAGTYGGTKKILSFGAGVDHHESYTAFAVDGFFDWPVGPDVVTAQFAVLHYNGGTWMGIPTLPPTMGVAVPKKVTAVVGEAGYRISQLKLSPILRVENQSATVDPPMDPMIVASPSVLRFSAGLAWWLMGQTVNVKLFYTYVKPDNSIFRTYNQLNLQVQLYVF